MGVGSMKATGIIRRMDDLGRIVIPRSVREHIKAEEGQPYEFFIEDNGDIVLRAHKVDKED